MLNHCSRAVIWLSSGPTLPVDVKWMQLRREMEAIVGSGFPSRDLVAMGFLNHGSCS